MQNSQDAIVLMHYSHCGVCGNSGARASITRARNGFSGVSCAQSVQAVACHVPFQDEVLVG